MLATALPGMTEMPVVVVMGLGRTVLMTWPNETVNVVSVRQVRVRILGT